MWVHIFLLLLLCCFFFPYSFIFCKASRYATAMSLIFDDRQVPAKMQRKSVEKCWHKITDKLTKFLNVFVHKLTTMSIKWHTTKLKYSQQRNVSRYTNDDRIQSVNTTTNHSKKLKPKSNRQMINKCMPTKWQHTHTHSTQHVLKRESETRIKGINTEIRKCKTVSKFMRSSRRHHINYCCMKCENILMIWLLLLGFDVNHAKIKKK